MSATATVAVAPDTSPGEPIRDGSLFLPAVSEDRAEQRAEAAADKWSLWSQGVTLRGANVYQQEDSGTPWYPLLVQEDLKDLAQSGANYVNFSVPGPYNVAPPYGPNHAFARRLDEVVSWAEAAGLYVVLSFRTGPGRGEFDITGEGAQPFSRHLFQDAKAQQSFLAMWKEVRDHTPVPAV